MCVCVLTMQAEYVIFAARLNKFIRGIYAQRWRSIQLPEYVHQIPEKVASSIMKMNKFLLFSITCWTFDSVFIFFVWAVFG